MLDIVETKVLVAFLFCGVQFSCGTLPLKLYKYLKILDGEEETKKNFVNERRHKQVICGLGLFQAFGGGAIFATCFLHMMPQVYEATLELKKFGLINTHYPFSQLIVSIGFFLVYFAEVLSQYLTSKFPEEDIVIQLPPKGKGWAKPVSSSNKILPKEDEGSIKNEKPMIELKRTGSQGSEIATINVDDFEYTTLKEKNNYVEQKNEYNIKKAEELIQDGQDGLGFETVKEQQQVEELDKIIDTRTINLQRIFKGMLLVFALSLHAFFEGLAIGMQLSIPNIWYLFIAVSIHSASLLFSISMDLLMAKAKIRTILTRVLILSITSPIGVFIGLLITLGAEHESKSRSIAMVCLEGLSAGTITYITFFEVLLREKDIKIFRVRRAVFIILGFAFMASLECFEFFTDI